MYKHFSKFTDLVSSVIVGGHGFEGQFESLASNPDVIIATPGRLAQVLVKILSLQFAIFFVKKKG
jgi:ATP-dependent RNA helicase DDX54/DBP10